MNFNIEKGLVPAIVRPSEGSKYDVLPLSQMIIGDSIFISKEFSTSSSISSFLSIYNKKHTESLFVLRKAENGCRVFKLEKTIK